MRIYHHKKLLEKRLIKHYNCQGTYSSHSYRYHHTYCILHIALVTILNYFFFLCRPDMCPDDLYSIIVQCNYHQPDERPDFSSIVALLQFSTSLNDDSVRI